MTVSGVKVVDASRFAAPVTASSAMAYVAATRSTNSGCGCGGGCGGCGEAPRGAVLRTVDTRRFAAAVTPSAASGYLDNPIPARPAEKPVGRVTPTGLIVGPGPLGQPRDIYEREPRPVPDRLRLRSSAWRDPRDPRFPCSRMHPPQCDGCPDGYCVEAFMRWTPGGGEYTYFCAGPDWSDDEIYARGRNICRDFAGFADPMLCDGLLATPEGQWRRAGCGWRCGDDRADQSAMYTDDWSRRRGDFERWRGACF